MRIFGFICLGMILILLLVISYQLHKGNAIRLCIIYPMAEVENKKEAAYNAAPKRIVEEIQEPEFNLSDWTGKQNEKTR